MTKKIRGGIFKTALLVLLAGLALAAGLLYHYYNIQLTAELEDKTRYVAAGVEAQGTDYLETLEETQDRITLIAADGTVLYDNMADVASMENHAARSEVQEALAGSVGTADRISDTLSLHTRYCAVMLSNGQVLRLADTQLSLWALLGRMLLPVLAAAGVTVLVSALLASTLAKNIVRPINEIDPAAPALTDSYEELAPLQRRLREQNEKISQQMEELQRRQKEFTVISDNMCEGLLLLNGRGEVLAHNKSAAEIFSIQPQTAVGRNALEINRSSAFRTVIDEVLAGRHAVGLMPLNGRSYELLGSPVPGESQTPGAPLAGMVLLAVDVTEREAGEQMRREFTANVSHELKTPLTSIYGISDMMVSGMVKPADVPGFAQDINREASRLIALVDDILRLSRLDAGENAAASPEKVDLHALCVEAAKSLAPLAAPAQIAIQVEGKSVTVFGVHEMLYEIVRNLCDNAVKYNVPGGSVTLCTDWYDRRPRLRISDTGIGIPKEDFGRIFERFFRVDKSHSRQVGGTGLGLSIVKHAAQYHHAELSVESTVGVGTCITVMFSEQSDE